VSFAKYLQQSHHRALPRLAAKAELMGIKTLLNDPPRQDTENLPEFVELGAALSADIVTFHTPLSFDGKYPSSVLSWWVIEQSFDTHQLSLSGKTRANITHTDNTQGFLGIVKT
jgi:hypothetical protein